MGGFLVVKEEFDFVDEEPLEVFVGFGLSASDNPQGEAAFFGSGRAEEESIEELVYPLLRGRWGAEEGVEEAARDGADLAAHERAIE